MTKENGDGRMLQQELFEVLYDNIPYGIYILDDRGNYIYVNSTYVESIGTSKTAILGTNVQEFVRRKEIEFCVSDIVYREKHRVSMLQDAYLQAGLARRYYQQLIVSSPILDARGEVKNVIAICIPMDMFVSLCHEAEKKGYHLNYYKSEKKKEKQSVIAESSTMRYLLEVADMVAKTDTSVLITGDSGTGKEVLAQFIHRHSSRAQEKLVVINCASLPENLLEAELFGYEKGAFTGAAPGGKKGLMEEADGGTLFLDEINSLPIVLQGKLLRALEEKTIKRIGATKTKRIDFRLLTASNEDLENAVKKKKFRLDLYYRLNVIPLKIPALKDRIEDIRPLAQYFLLHYNSKYAKNNKFTERTLTNMEEYDWPGNVRELKNFVERAVVMSADELIDISNIADISKTKGLEYVVKNVMHQQNVRKERKPFETINGERLPLADYLSQCEKEYVKYALENCKNTYAAAEFLGTSQSAVMRKKKKYSL